MKEKDIEDLIAITKNVVNGKARVERGMGGWLRVGDKMPSEIAVDVERKRIVVMHEDYFERAQQIYEAYRKMKDGWSIVRNYPLERDSISIFWRGRQLG